MLGEKSASVRFKCEENDCEPTSFPIWVRNIKGKAHYGWLRLTVRLSGHARITATLTGYAYETVANKPIIAGATKGPDDEDQQAPASLNMHTRRPRMLCAWALGAPGMSIWRREESVASTPDGNCVG